MVMSCHAATCRFYTLRRCAPLFGSTWYVRRERWCHSGFLNGLAGPEGHDLHGEGPSLENAVSVGHFCPPLVGSPPSIHHFKFRHLKARVPQLRITAHPPLQ